MEMVKRLMVLLGMLALLLTTAVPVLAQEEAQYGGAEVSATGVIFDGLPADAGGFGTHSISDDATGTLYALRSAGPDLDSYGSQQVTVYGALTPGVPGSGEEGIEGNGTLPSIDVTRVEPAGGPIEATPCDEFLPGGEVNPDYDPTLPECASGDGITATFELAAECEPPAGTTFYGLVGQQPTQLTDPDGDGLYEGILTLSADFGTFPIPVGIIAGDPANPQGVIEDFGEVVLEDGDVFPAGVSFCDGTQPVDPVDPAPGVDVDGDGSVDASDGEEAARVSDSAKTAGGARVLPDTGGATLVLLGAGALLMFAGFLVRRAAR